MMDRRTFFKRSAAALAAFSVAPHVTDVRAAPPPGEMRRRVIPSSGDKLPVVGLGTWQTFDPRRLTPEQLAPLKTVLRVLREHGGRVVDSSPMYGKAERVLGDLSAEVGVNDALFIATKVWTRGRSAGVEQMQRSMALLQRDTLELMQVHNLVDWQTHLATLKQWQDEGKLRYVGITHYQPHAFDALARIMKREGVDFVQLPYSVVTRDAERRLLPVARETDTAVLVNRPFEGGRLFGAVKDRALPDEFQPFADTWAQAFLKFILAHPAVTAVIPGTSDPEHMRDNARAGYGDLPDEKQREALARFMQNT